MGLYIGNPTNIIVSQAYGLSFLRYSAWMALPTLFSVFSSLCTTFLWFYKEIPRSIAPSAAAPNQLGDRKGAIIGSALLLTCLLCLMVVPLFHSQVPVWLIMAPFTAAMLIRDAYTDILHFKQSKMAVIEMTQVKTESRSGLEHGDGDNEIRAEVLEGSQDDLFQRQNEESSATKFRLLKETKTFKILERLPWSLIPFCLGMFTLVEALNAAGLTEALAMWLSGLQTSGIAATIFAIGFLSTLSCNLLNNLPMTILFSRVLRHPAFLISQSQETQSIQKAAFFSLIIGSNLGANVLFVGSLAGLMWNGLLKNNERHAISQWAFFKSCLIVTPITAAVACSVLTAEMYLWQ